MADTADLKSARSNPVRVRVPPPLLYMKQNKTKTDWKALDWDKRDIDLAKELGCSREYIRQRRNLLGMPQSPFHKQHASSVKALCTLSSITQPMTLKEANRKTGGEISANVLRNTLKDLGQYKKGYRRVRQLVSQEDLWRLKAQLGMSGTEFAVLLGQTKGGMSRMLYGNHEFRLPVSVQKKTIQLLRRKGFEPSGKDIS